MHVLVNSVRLLSVFLLLLAAVPLGAAASDSDDVLALYRTFAEAQNRRDLPTVRRLLVDSPQFLWVTDGTAVWGADALIERMRLFQRSEVWQVEPDLDKAVIVPLSTNSAMLHIPLTLIIGSKTPGPDRLHFLVEVICLRTPAGWKIAALLTTTEKRQS